MAWQAYLRSRIERLEDDLRRLDDVARQHIDYANAWRGLRDARVLGSLPEIPGDLRPVQPADWDPPPPPAAPASGVRAIFSAWKADHAGPSFACVHRADAAFLTIADPVTFRARARDIQAKLLTAGFSAADPRPPAWKQTLNRLLAATPVADGAAAGGAPPAGPPQHPAVTQGDRVELRAMSEEVDQRLEGTQYGIRRFRDRVIMGSTILAVLALGVLVASIFQPDFFSLCATMGGQVSCPLPGSTSPGRWDLTLLTLVALLGGGLAALPLLNQSDTGLSPYTLSTAQALLKLPAAGAAGIAGLFALQRGLLDVLKPQAGPVVLGYALAFGLSQQAVTRLIDARASKLLSGNGGAAPPADHQAAPPAGAGQ